MMRGRVSAAMDAPSLRARGLGTSRVFAECTAGLFDGFRIDEDGRVWASAADGVHCHDPDGTLIVKVRVPELVSNVCFGGDKLNRLFICGTTSLHSIFLAINGLAPAGARMQR